MKNTISLLIVQLIHEKVEVKNLLDASQQLIANKQVNLGHRVDDLAKKRSYKRSRCGSNKNQGS